ncbi:MAG TPA: ribosomal protein S18-alanine N-acetyltransferase [Candidatus Limnocylindrales bacterium]|jgi:ribosomal-protein-alanine N-acetyltransferase|nr:ribosomal protein S18-alanine N-acetyltransferase [Candidatus Limnocylindrales bacterium]
MVQIRQAVRVDLIHILELAAREPSSALWPAEKYDNYFAQKTEQKWQLLLASEGGTVIGFIAARSLHDECEIENIVVSRSMQRRGVASELLKHLFSTLSDRIERVFLEVRESNQPAIRLYEKAGFMEVGRRKSYYREPPEDALIMKKSFGKLA